MDLSLNQYKGKLQEALTLFPQMSQDKKHEAVAYWNNVAGQLTEIVKEDTTYTHETPTMNPELDVNMSRQTTSAMYDTSIEYTNPSAVESSQYHNQDIIGNNSSIVIDDSHGIITPALEQTQIPDFHQENLIEKTLYNNMYSNIEESSLLAIEGCKEHHLPVVIGEKIDNQVQSTISTYTIDPNIICRSQSNSNDQIGDSIESNGYTVVELSEATEVLSQKSVAQIDPNAGLGVNHIADPLSDALYCPSTEMTTQNSPSHILNYLPITNANANMPTIRLGELNDRDSAAQHDSLLTDNSLNLPIPGPASAMNSDVLVTPTKLYDASINFSPLECSASSIPSSQGTTFDHARDDLCTRTEGPLQQIQQSNVENGYYVEQPYAFTDVRNNEFGRLEEFRRHDQFHLTQKDDSSLESDLTKPIQVVKNELMLAKEDTDNSEFRKQHTCSICGKSGYSTIGNLRRHIKAHSGAKPFKCEFCDSCFTEKKSLVIHIRRHTGEKPYKCVICEKLFSQTGVLQSHMALHYNERKFDCNKCGKAFRQRSQLKLHLMRHDGIKRLECSTCMAKFMTKGDMLRHQRTHTGERPYACQLCEKTFTRKQSLNEHLNRHTGKKPYDCKYCDKTFSEMSACYKHKKTHEQ